MRSTPVIDLVCPHCGETKWRLSYAESDVVRLTCCFCEAREAAGQRETLDAHGSKTLGVSRYEPAHLVSETSKVSPLTIEIMLACYYSPEPQNHVKSWSSIAGASKTKWLLKNGLLSQPSNSETPEPTERGLRWIAAILSTPLPR